RSIVVLGDSLAVGVGASSPDRGFVGLLVQKVRVADPGAALVNYASPGATAADVAGDQLRRAFEESADATDVWLCVGGNDVTHATPADEFSSTEHGLVASLRARWPRAHIVIFGVPDLPRSPLLP